MRLSLPVVLGMGAIAAMAQVSGPTLGYVAENGQIRPIFGIAPAAAIGGAIDPGRAVALASVSPNQSFVLATAADTGELLLIIPGSGTTVVTGVATGPDEIFMSPSGTAAALWFGSVDHVQVVSGLPGSPSVRTIDTTFLETPPIALAVSDDGQWVAGAWNDGVYAFGPEGQVTRLPLIGSVTALAFFHGRADLAAATYTQVSTVANIDGSQQVSTIFSAPAVELPGPSPKRAPAQGPGSTPGANYIAVSFDNRQIVVADALGSVSAFDPASGAAARSTCGCSPSGVFGLGGSVFRLTGAESGALKIYDASTGDVFVAPPAPAATGALP